MQVNNHDPILDLAWYQKFFLHKSEKERRCCSNYIIIVIAINYFANIHDYYRSIFCISSTDVQKAWFEYFRDKIYLNREQLSEPSTVFN